VNCHHCIEPLKKFQKEFQEQAKSPIRVKKNFQEHTKSLCIKKKSNSKVGQFGFLHVPQNQFSMYQ